MSLGFAHHGHGHGHHYQHLLHSTNPYPNTQPYQTSHQHHQQQQQQQTPEQQQAALEAAQQQAAENRRRSYQDRYAVPCEHPANQWYSDERPHDVLRRRQRPNTKVLHELLIELAADTRLTRLLLTRFMDFYDPPPPTPDDPEPMVEDPDPGSETDTDTEISSDDERDAEEERRRQHEQQQQQQQDEQIQQQLQQQEEAGPSNAASQASDPREGSSRNQEKQAQAPRSNAAPKPALDASEYPDDFKYTERDLRLLSHDLNKRATAAEEAQQTFPLFSRLPNELQDRIWSEALPTCRYINYTSPLSSDHRNWPLPIPQLAKVCRSARDAVMRRGQHVVFHKETRYDWLEGYNDPWSLRLGRDEKAGFLMKSDAIYLSRYPHIVTRNVAQVVGEWPVIGKIKTWRWTAETAQEAVRNATTLYVHWENMNLGFAETVEPESPHRMSRCMQWELLKESTNLKTLLVDFREPIEVKAALRMPIENQDEELHSRDSNGSVARLEQLVDLFDDERLAELRSLQTVATRNSERDNFLLARGSFRPTRCVKCEREQWHLYDKTLAERTWLSLHSNELSPEEMPLVFPDDRTYNTIHPWVLEKKAKMPTIVPVLRVKITFFPIAELHYQNERFTKYGRRRMHVLPPPR